MRMICDRVVCKGGDRLSRKNYGRKEARLILFPDGIHRLIVMSQNDWTVIDRDGPITINRYFYRLKGILEHSQSCASHYGWTVERAIQYLFRLGIVGLARKEEYGGSIPANDDDWADTMVRAQLPYRKSIQLTKVFMSSVKGNPINN